MSSLRLSLILIKSILILLINFCLFGLFFGNIYKTKIMATSKYQLGLISPNIIPWIIGVKWFFLVKTALYQFYNGVLFFPYHFHITWQAKPPVKNIWAYILKTFFKFSYAAITGDKILITEIWLQMHRFPYWTTLHVVLLKHPPYFFRWRLALLTNL